MWDVIGFELQLPESYTQHGHGACWLRILWELWFLQGPFPHPWWIAYIYLGFVWRHTWLALVWCNMLGGSNQVKVLRGGKNNLFLCCLSTLDLWYFGFWSLTSNFLKSIFLEPEGSGLAFVSSTFTATPWWCHAVVGHVLMLTLFFVFFSI